MDSEDIQFILQRMNENKGKGIPPDVKDELTEQEGLQIYHEILNVLSRHNVSYKCACNISISLVYALLTGAAELYDMDIESQES